MLSTTVKVSSVTNLSDARYCAGMGVDMLGFTLDEDDPNYVSPEKYNEIRSWVAGVQLVGETRSADAGEILLRMEKYSPDMLQISIPEMLPLLSKELDIPLLLRLDVDQVSPEILTEILQKYGDLTRYVLLESSQNNDLDEEWKTLLRNHEFPLLLGCGLTNIEQVHEYLREYRLAGISLTGSDEERPGYKDYGLLMDILESLETD